MIKNARVYVVRADDGTLKVGVSKNPERRSKQFGRPVQLVHATAVMEHAERIERLAHRVLALHGKHLRGEWFEADLADAIGAIEAAVRQAEGSELPLGGKLRYQGKLKAPSKVVMIRMHQSMLDRIDAVIEHERYGQGDRATLIREAVAQFLRDR